MLNCLDVAKYFISKAYQSNKQLLMTNMKVQKLLYYSQSLYLALFDEPLFDEQIQAWRHGPVCPPVYHNYCSYQGRSIPEPLDCKEALLIIPLYIKETLDEVWSYFGEHHACYLSDMTHMEFPWNNARKGLPLKASSEEEILREDMKLLGRQKLDDIERENPDYQKIISRLLKETFCSEIEPKYIKQEEVNDWLQSLLA